MTPPFHFIVIAGLVPATQDHKQPWMIMGGRHKGGHDGVYYFSGGQP
jgi:hypothetical protein